MRIAIFGAGAVGGILGARLAAAGHDVALIARGAQLAALRADGLHYEGPDGARLHVRPTATDDPAAVGPQDAVFVTTKAHGLAEVVPALAPLIGPDTATVFVQNGIPWWYTYGLGGPLDGTPLDSVDPGGRIAAAMPPERAIGCVTYVGSVVPEPGHIVHTGHSRFILGTPAGPVTPACGQLAATLVEAGLEGSATETLRDAVWLKLWGNLSFNPTTALLNLPTDRVARDPDGLALLGALMEEARQVAEHLGTRFPMTTAQRLDDSRTLGSFRTSMLQDRDMGRPMEVEPLVGAVSELGAKLGIATPAVDTVLRLIRILDRSLQA